MQKILYVYCLILRKKNVLPSSFLRRIWNPLNPFAPKYPNRNLKQLLVSKIGEIRLRDVAEKYITRPVFLFAALDMSPELPEVSIPEFQVAIYNSAYTRHANEKLVTSH